MKKNKEHLKENSAFNKKVIGLFDHVKHISQIQDPNYFINLSDEDKKSFNHFMILKALSMNPDNLEITSYLYRFFDKIPPPQFYVVLISLIPSSRRFYPWIKNKNKDKYSNELLELIVKKFEVSSGQAGEYIDILNSSENGKKELIELCSGFGLNEREIDKILKNNHE